MADENSTAPENIPANNGLEGIVVKNVPFVGGYSARVFELKHQAILPSDLRKILKIRQGAKCTSDIILFCQRGEGVVYLLDNPEEESCPETALIGIERTGRIVLPSDIFTKPYANYVGHSSYIEVTPSDSPLFGSQIRE